MRSVAVQAWWVKCHQSLLPDYNRKAALYWWTVVLIGAGLIFHSLRVVWSFPAEALAQVVVGITIAILAGSFPIRIATSKISFAAGETFIFLLLLLHGPAAAALAAAGEGFIGSWRSSKRWSSRIGTPAMASIAMISVGSLQQAAVKATHVSGLYNPAVLLTLMMLCSLLYFILNTLLVTTTINLKRNQWPPWNETFASFGWVGLTYAASAALACLIFLSTERSGTSVLLAVVPILVMLLIALHFFFRQQETAAALEEERTKAAEQEARMAAEHLLALQSSEWRFHSAFTHAALGMALVSADGRIVKANLALNAMLGLNDETTLEQRPFSDVIGDGEITVLYEQLARLRSRQTRAFTANLRLRHLLGNEVLASVHGSIFSEADSDSPVIILQLQDITLRRKAETDLHHIAFHDSLTGLANRRQFREDLALAFDRLRTRPPRHFSLMFLDIDRFKMINDSLGHAMGDDLLMAVARRIKDQLRPHDIIARLGGDEFAILAEDMDSEPYAESLADRLVDSLLKPFQIAGMDIYSSVSIGITFSVMGYEKPEDMLRDADTALYKAKATGKSRYAVFDATLHAEVSYRLRLERDLRRALHEEGLRVVYQPLFDLSSDRITGFEALARWDHPELGAISPEVFIAVASEAGLILEITDFMLQRASGQLREWQLSNVLFHDLHININISERDLVQPGLVARVTTACTAAELEPKYMTLELTENILMKHLEASLPVLSDLRRHGVGLSVDDFGTGYSSLQHLSALPITNLKIDRCFVLDVDVNSDKRAIVQAVVTLARSLGKSVCAEGIETAAQLELLRSLDCSMGQGYFLSHPLSAELASEMLSGLTAQATATPLREATNAAQYKQVALMH